MQQKSHKQDCSFPHLTIHGLVIFLGFMGLSHDIKGESPDIGGDSLQIRGTSPNIWGHPPKPGVTTSPYIANARFLGCWNWFGKVAIALQTGISRARKKLN